MSTERQREATGYKGSGVDLSRYMANDDEMTSPYVVVRLYAHSSIWYRLLVAVLCSKNKDAVMWHIEVVADVMCCRCDVLM